MNATYDRLFFFADLNTPGKCFAIFTETVKRTTYPQNWAAYNRAQTNEADHFQTLLRDLVADLPEPEQRRGRPRASLADSVFCAAFKVYSTVSTRRFMSDQIGRAHV